MKVVLISMPDVTPIVIHEAAVHMPNLGIASVGGNIDPEHAVFLIDLVRKRRQIRSYLTSTLKRINPDVVGLSSMAWQYHTCTRLAKLIKQILPEVKVVVGGYHPTLMSEEIAASPEAKWFDFLIRGEGEEACRRLVNALEGRDRFEDIPSLSYKQGDEFVHNKRGGPLDLSTLKPPIRDRRRLTWGYHIVASKAEVMETSRGCTRSCNFCSMKHMYGKTFRTFPIDRVLSDLDNIYYKRRTRGVFIVDDNFVLNPKRVMTLCDAIAERKYKDLNLIVQADCISVAKNEEMVERMARAGFRTVFLGIENVSRKNLEAAHKGNTVEGSREAVRICQKHGLMVIGGLILGFPDDDEQAIVENYEFLKDVGADGAICQILTPYPKTDIRTTLMNEGLVTNRENYERYTGLWANVRTRHLDADRLQYLFWYHRQRILGWWNPSRRARRQQGMVWTGFWIHLFRPVLRFFVNRTLRRHGWEGRHQRVLARLARVNEFKDLEAI